MRTEYFLILSCLCGLFFSFMNFGFEFPFSFVLQFGYQALLVGLAGGILGVASAVILFAVNRFVIRLMTRTNTEAVLIAGLVFNLGWLLLLRLQISTIMPPCSVHIAGAVVALFLVKILPVTSVLYWVTWNLFPATLFAISVVLRRAGR